MNVSFSAPSACQALSAAFYARAEQDALFRPLPPGSLPGAADRFGAWLAQFLAEPRNSSDPGWSPSLRETRERFPLDESGREAWLANIGLALDDVGVEEPVRGCLARLFEALSLRIVRGDEASADDDQGVIADLWAEQRLMEELVNAVRTLDVKKALQLAEAPVAARLLARDRAALLILLARMCESGNPALLDFVRGRLLADPRLARDRDTRGRTLLHGAAEAGCLDMVRMLLRHGAAVNETDQLLHNAVSRCAYACGAPGGPAVIRALARAGARIDLPDAAGQCTPLHMAARQGNIGIGEALIECGADLEARDARGNTPLRSAVDAGKVHMAEMLAERGADVYSPGSDGLTVTEAAKSERMRRVLVDSTLQALIALSRHVRSADRPGTMHGALELPRQRKYRMRRFPDSWNT
ncbi:MAG: ankyrin repeat domain-containing protein [Acidobacteriota bacterium]